MSTRSFGYLTRLTQAIFAIALCGTIAASVPAQGGRDRSDRDSARGGAARRQSGPRDSGSGRPEMRGGKTDTPRDAARERRDVSERRGRWESGNRPGSDSRRPNADKPRNDYRSGRGHGWDNQRHDNWRGRREGRDYRPDYRTYRDRPFSIYTPRRDYRYRPPTLRGGFYFYSSRPGNRPHHYGYWAFDDCDPAYRRRSVYFHFGIFPYIRIGRVHVMPYVSLRYYDRPIAINAVGLEVAMADIREAWLDGRPDLIDRHLSGSQRIAVLLDGRYDYSVDADDYDQMTSDAIDEVRTISFTWESVRERTDGDFTAFGRHVFRDSSGIIRTLYVSYTLRRIGGDYVITEVGTSGSPLM